MTKSSGPAKWFPVGRERVNEVNAVLDASYGLSYHEAGRKRSRVYIENRAHSAKLLETLALVRPGGVRVAIDVVLPPLGRAVLVAFHLALQSFLDLEDPCVSEPDHLGDLACGAARLAGFGDEPVALL